MTNKTCIEIYTAITGRAKTQCFLVHRMRKEGGKVKRKEGRRNSEIHMEIVLYTRKEKATMRFAGKLGWILKRGGD